MKTTISAFKLKNILIFFFTVLLYLFSNAQYYYEPLPAPQYKGNNAGNNKNGADDKVISSPTGYISINFGIASPSGSYANSFGSSYGGYALPGFGFSLSIAFPINHSNFGIAFMYGQYDNTYDINKYVANLNTTSTNFQYQATPPPYGTSSYSDSYTISSIMGGGYVTYPLGRFSFDGRLMLGAAICSLPEQNYLAVDAQGNTYQYDLLSSNSVGFAFDAGIGIRFLILKINGQQPLCTMINVDYLYSNPYYRTEQNLYQTPGTGPNAGITYQLVPSPNLSGHIPISLSIITVGIGYQFGK